MLSVSELYEFDCYCYYTWQHVLIVIMCDTNVCLDCRLSKLKGGIFNALLWTMFPNMKCKYFRSSSRKVCAVGWILDRLDHDSRNHHKSTKPYLQWKVTLPDWNLAPVPKLNCMMHIYEYSWLQLQPCKVWK